MAIPILLAITYLAASFFALFMAVRWEVGPFAPALVFDTDLEDGDDDDQA